MAIALYLKVKRRRSLDFGSMFIDLILSSRSGFDSPQEILQFDFPVFVRVQRVQHLLHLGGRGLARVQQGELEVFLGDDSVTSKHTERFLLSSKYRNIFAEKVEKKNQFN